MNKKIILIMGIFVMVGVVYALATITVTRGGLVGHWVLDAESYDSNTERITDKTPYENHGTNYGATLTTDQMGQSDRAMSFDGSSDYVDAGNDDSLDMNTNDFSIVTWINTNFEPNQIRILVVENGSSMGGWDTKLISLGYDVTINSSITTKAEVDAYNPDIVACLKYAWGCTKGALLNELYDAGYLLFSEGNDQTNNIRPIETYESTNTQAGTIQADESHPITNGWSTTGGSGTDNRRGITAIHANAYSIANDSSLNYTEAVYLEEPGKGRWYHHQPNAVATDKLIENAVYYLVRHEIVSKGNSYNLFLNNYTLKGFINNETVNTTISSGWNHVSLTYDGATQKLYVNNELKESNLFSSSIETNSDNLTIGTIFNGSISSVKIYNHALSADEIATLYHSYRPKLSSGSLQKGLVGHWALDGESLNNITNRTTDKTPYSNHGTVYGATLTTDQMGQSDRAMSFAGVDDYVRANLITEITREGHYTFSSWIYYLGPGNGNYETIFQNSFSSTDRNGMVIDSNVLRFGYYDGLSWHGASGSINLNEWSHVAGVNNGSILSLYINGELQTGTSGPYVSSDANYLYIGKASIYAEPHFWNPFNGSISDVRIYNHVLSADEIDTLYHSYRPKASSGSLQKGLVLDMPLKSKYTKDETAGSEVMTDRTPYSNDGQNYGATVGSSYTDFDGVDDYIDLPNDLGYTTQVSAFAWFKREGDPLGNYHIIFGPSQFEISIPDPGGSLRTGIMTTDNRFVSNHGSGLLDGEWHFIGFTFDGTVKKSYIDGQYVGEQTGITGPLLYDFSYRRMGRHGTSGVYYLNGSISNARIYNRALSASEIKLLYDKGR